jgi:hypothetical protein
MNENRSRNSAQAVPNVSHHLLRVGDGALDIVRSPLQHLLALLRVLSKHIHSPDALTLMHKRLLDHVLVEARWNAFIPSDEFGRSLLARLLPAYDLLCAAM